MSSSFFQQCMITRAKLVPLRSRFGSVLATFSLQGTCPSHALLHQVNINFTHCLSLSHFPSFVIVSLTHTHTSTICQEQQMLRLCFCAFKLLSGLYQEMKCVSRRNCIDGFASLFNKPC